MLALWLMQDRPYGDERRLAAAALRQLAGRQAANPVRIRMLAWRQAWTAIRDALFDESLPDVVEVGSTWRLGLAELGVWLPRPQDIPAGRWMRPLSGGRSDETVPWTRDVRVLYFRRSVLADAGLQPRQLATWEDLAQACRRISRQGRVEPLAVPGQAEPTLTHTAAMWIWAHGGEVVDPSGRAGFRRGLPGSTALADLFTWAERGLLAQEALRQDAVTVYEGFRAGRYAFTLASTAGPASRVLDDADVGVVPVPVSRLCERTSYEGGTCLGVTRFAADPQAAWDGVRSIVHAVRDDMAQHLVHTRRVLHRALAEVGTSVPYRRRLRSLPDLPAWAALETRWATRLSEWLARAARGERSGLADEVEDEAQAFERVLAL